ncbi:MAG: hypothetical protein H0X29_00335 [Parachlamydiaceae bacterium]|nr:hypothetical protein [Parachlamydiaceae bacterium]
MQVRRFLGKIAGSYLAISALSVSAYAAADMNNMNPSHDQMGGWENSGHDQMGNWGNPNHDQMGNWGNSNHDQMGGWANSGHDQMGGWGHSPVNAESSWVGGPSSCCPAPCEEACNQPPSCGEAFNPPGYFNCSNSGNCNGGFIDSLRFRADFLYWRASQDCLSLGREESLSQFPGGARIESSRERSPHYRYDPGFRIGIATVCPSNCWDLALNWTHFHSKANINSSSACCDNSSNHESVFVSEWQRISNAFPDSASGRWKLDLDYVDLELGRKFYVSSCFILRPHFGLRGGRIDQHFRVKASANRSNAYQDFGSSLFVSEVTSKNNFRGIGPRLGLDLELAMPCLKNMKLFGQAAGSLVYGKFDRHSREHFHDYTNDALYDGFGDVDFEGHASKYRTTRGMTDLTIGLKWEHCCNWCNRSHPLTVAVAWEHHAFYNMNHFISSCGGDLTTQGLTITAEIGF